MTRLQRFFGFVLGVVCLATAAAAHAQTPTVDNWSLVSELRITRTLFEYTYRAVLTNPGAAIGGATATLTSTSPSTVVVDGVLSFGPVGSGGTATSLDTFTIRQDRAVPFDVSALSWAITTTPPSQNTPPVANAGPDQDVPGVGVTVTLNGALSSDVDGDPLTFAWEFLARPAGSGAVLSGASTVAPTFVPDKKGTYIVQLTADDGSASASDTVAVTVGNTPPVANAGPDQDVPGVGVTVTLNGALSSDVDGDPLTFGWEFLARPAGSGAVLSGASTVAPTFVPDKKGSYVVRLTVNDGSASATDDVTIVVGNTPPVAHAGSDQTVATGATVTLNGSLSSDVDGDAITYAWAFASRPAGSGAVLSGDTTVIPTFVADLAGDYEIDLVVSDGSASSEADRVRVTVIEGGIVTVQPSTLAFAPQQTGTVSAGETITVANNRSEAVTGLTVVLPGADFQLGSNTCPAALPAGQSCTFQVAFSPAAAGPRTGTATIEFLEGSTPASRMVSLTGNGVDPALSVTPASLAFGPQQTGTTSPAQQVEIRNTGIGPVALTSIDASGDFARTHNCPATLDPGAACQVSVTFAPNAAGARPGQLTVLSTAAGGPRTVELSGTGQDPTLAVTPASLAFGPQQTGTTSDAQAVTIANTGIGPVAITAIAATGDFAVAPACPATLAAGESCQAEVTFSPAAAGTRTGVLSVTSTAAGSPHTVALEGDGRLPTLDVAPAVVAFGTQIVASTSQPRTVTLTNGGVGPIVLASIDTTGDFAAVGCGGTLAPSASCDLTVTFTPTILGLREGQITITSNSSTSPQLVSLSGTGVGNPLLLSVTPATGAQGATLDVAIVGEFTNFAQGTTSANFGQGIAVNGVSVTSPTTATVNITISPIAFVGSRDVTMTTGGEFATKASAFSVTAGPAALTAVAPGSGVQGQALAVSLTGSQTHFAAGATSVSFGAGIAVGTVSVSGPTSLSVEIVIDPAATPGVRTVTAATGGEQVSLAGAFSVSAATAFITDVSPATGQQGQTLNVDVTGQSTSFVQGQTTATFGAGITVNTVTVSSATAARINVSIDPLASLGGRAVTLTTGGQVATGGVFSVVTGPARLTSVTPDSAVQGEQKTIAVVGADTHFQQGVTGASFGGGVDVLLVTVASPTSASVIVEVAPLATPGARTVTLTTAGESASLAGAFTVVAGTPVISSIAPTNGLQGQTLSVTLTGQFTAWAQGQTSVGFGNGIVVNSLTVNTATSLTADITIAPTATTGPRTVTVTTGSQVLTTGFGVGASGASISVNPASAQQGDSLAVAITGTGTHFATSVTTVSFGAGITVDSFTVDSATSITAQVTVGDAASPGGRTVTVATEGEVVTAGFTVTAGTPAFASLTPNSGQQGQTLNVSITGRFTSFVNGVTTASFGGGVTVNSVTVTDATHALANIAIAPTTSTGWRSVTVTTGAEVVTATNGFLVNAGPAILTALSPTSAQQGRTLDVAVTGSATHFLQGTTTATFGSGITINSVTVAGATSATVSISIQPGASVGLRTVTLVTDGEAAPIVNGFTVLAGTPVVTSATPSTAQQGQTLDVTVLGQFTSFGATTTASFGAGISVNTVNVSSATSATVNITVSPLAHTGGRQVTMTTGGEVAVSGYIFSVLSGPALVSQLAPTSARQGDALTVAVTGQNTHFAQNVTTANFGAGVSVGAVTVTGPTTANVAITIQAFATPGLRTVTLTTEGESASIVNGFNVLAGTPVITFVSPSSAQQGQTLDVAVTGQFTNFVQGTTTAGFGLGVSVNSVTVHSATSATVNVTVNPTATLGQRTVTMTTGSEVASSLGGPSFFSVTAGPAAISSVAPNSGRQAQNLASVAITGTATHFLQGQTSASFGAGITVTSFVVNNSTSATAAISILPSASLGARAVTLTTGGEVASLAGGFTVTPGLPALTSVTPATGHQAETLAVSVAGQFTNFVQGATTASFGAGITVNSVTVQGATLATVNLTISPAAALGARTVTMTTGVEVAEIVGGFTVLGGQPTLYTIAPTSGTQGVSLTVQLNGAFTNWVQGTTAASFGSGISVGTVTVNGPTTASVPITISTAASIGPRTVTVTTGGEVVSLVNGFTVLQGVPVITAISPNAAVRGSTLSVTITGVFTNWQNGVTTAAFGSGVAVNSVSASPTLVVASVTIDAGATLGPRDVVVTTGAEVLTVAGGFTVTNVDTTAPGILTFSPQYNATGVPLNTVGTAEFNEPIDRNTVTTTTFRLYDYYSGVEIPGTVSVNAAGRVATFVPTQLLAVNHYHYFYLTNGIRDVAGNPFGGTTYYFTTGFASDTTGPALVRTNPFDGDTNVALNTRVMLEFDNVVNPATRSAGLQIRTGGATVAGTWEFSDGNRRVTFTPTSAFTASQVYTVTLTASLQDMAGNSLTNPGSFSFTAGTASDTTYPTVVSASPAPNDTDVGTTPVVEVIFSEPINPITVQNRSGSFSLYLPALNQYVDATVVVASDRRSATLTPNEPLLPWAQYYFVVYFADIAGNSNSYGASYFYTGAGPDTTLPQVVNVSPSDGMTGAPVNAKVVLRMSEAVAPTSVTGALQLTPAVTGTLALASDRVTLTFTPSAALPVNTTFTVQVSGLRDLSANVMSPFASTFASGPSATPDNTAPTLVSIAPANLATGVAVNTPIVMSFSEPITPGAVNASSMPITAAVPGVGEYWLAGAFTVNATATQVTFTPAAPYPGSARIRTYVNWSSTIKDLAGNNLVSTVPYFDTAATPDTTAPTVVAVSPPNGATGIGYWGNVVLTFSEAMNPSTLNSTTLTLFNGATRLGPGISVSSDNRTVVVSGGLPANAFITVVATSGAKDLTGNPLVEFSSTFSTAPASATDSPSIVTMRPGTGATGVQPTTPVVLVVNRPMNVATIEPNLYVSQNGVLVTGTITPGGDATTVTFTPDAPFAFGAVIQVAMTSGAEDTDGNPFNAFTGQFTIRPDPTTQAPAIVAATPAPYSSANPRNTPIDVEFSEPIDPVTVTTATFYLRDASNLPVNGTLSLRNGNRIIRFTPSAVFGADTYFYVYVTNGIRDLQNVAFPGTNYYFYTGGTSLTTTPTATIVPPNGAMNVGVNGLVRITFSEPINPLTVSASTVALTATGAVPTSFSFSNANRQVTVTPQVPLPGATLVTVTIDGVEGLGANPAAPQTSSFTTGTGSDTTAPRVVSANVYSGQVDVPVNTVFELTFSEPMDAPTILARASTFLYDSNVGYMGGTMTVSPDGRTLIFSPTLPLAVGRYHSIQVSNALDLAGNSMVSFSASFTSSFASDAVGPQLRWVSPAPDATSVPRNAVVTAVFDEPIDPTAFGNVNLLAGGSPVEITRLLSNGNRTLELRPAQPLATDTVYTIALVGVRDTSRNLAPTSSTSFTTRAGFDLVAPVATAWSPVNSDTGVPTNVALRATFSEPVLPWLFESTSYFYLSDSVRGGYVPMTVAVAPDRKSMIATPVEPLRPGSQYYWVAYFQDLAQNQGNTGGAYLTTANTSDATGPQVVLVTPPNAAAGVPVNARILVQLNEAIDPTSVVNGVIQVTPGVTGTLALSSDRVTLTFTPSAALAVSTTYTVGVTGLRDLAGNTMSVFNSTFTTGAPPAPDNTPPTLVSISPANGAGGQSVTTPIVMTFSEPITAGNVNIQSFPITAAIPGVGEFWFSGTFTVNAAATQVTFTPAGPYPAGATVRTYVNWNGTVKDLAGNNLAQTISSFTTAATPDGTAPTVSITPPNGTIGVGRNTAVVLAFSEPLNPNTATNGSTISLFAGPSRLSVNLAISSDNRTVVLSGTWPANALLTVFVADGVKDLSGNTVVPTSSTFTTANGSETNAPYVVTQRPTSGATGVAPSSVVTLFVSEPLAPTSVPGALYVSENGVLVSGSTVVNGDGTVVTFTPTAPFTTGAFVQVFLTSDALDLHGNALQSHVGQFTVATDPTTTPPTLVRTQPTTYSSSNPRNTVVDLEFSEPLNPATVTAASIYLHDAASQQVAGTRSLRNGNRTVRFTPSAALGANTYYYVYITTAVQDLQGQAFSGTNFYFYTGADSDVLTPTATIVPPAGATGVGVNVAVRVRFSEAINPLTVDPATVGVSAGPAVPVSFSLSDNNRLLTVTPQGTLPDSTTITVTLNGVEDLGVNAVAPQSVSFTTKTGGDTTAPAVVASSVYYNQADVPVNTAFDLTFSEPIDEPSLRAQAGQFLYDYTLGYRPGTFSLTPDGRTATFVPDAPLVASRQHALYLNNVLDLAGNWMSGFNTYFTTSSVNDTTAPMVQSVTPANGLTGVPRNAQIQVQFDELVRATSLGLVNVLVGGTPIPGVSRSLASSSRILTITLPAPMAAVTTHVVSVEGVEDTAGNVMAGTVTSTFTTGATVDVVGSFSVTAYSPANGATNVPLGSTAQVTFSEPINPISAVDAVVLRVSNTNAIVPTTMSFSADSRTVILTPTAPLANGTIYKIALDTYYYPTDLAGNYVYGYYSATFTTVP